MDFTEGRRCHGNFNSWITVYGFNSLIYHSASCPRCLSLSSGGVFLHAEGRRREDPVVMLEDTYSHAKIPVLYWENSIGQEKTCDISLPDDTISQDHAVLMRRESGWIITDTGSKVRHLTSTGMEISGDTEVLPGDVISVGSASPEADPCFRRGSEKQPRRRVRAASRKADVGHHADPVSSGPTVLFFGGGTVAHEPLIPFALLMVLGWGFYLFFPQGVRARQLLSWKPWGLA